MKKNKILAALAAIAALGLIAGRAQAQAETAAAVAAPLVVKTVRAVTPKPKPGETWLKAEVINFNSNSIIVREQGSERAIHTFTYAPVLKDRMQQLEDRGGYQYGDKVKILFKQGQTEALKIRGKPSKPL